MRAASDLHLAPHTASWVFQALADLRADAEAVGGPTVFAGDIWDQPKVVDVSLLNRLRDELRRFPGPVVVVPGNHDQYEGWRNACEALAGDNVRVVSEPALVEGVGLCIPYMAPAGWGAIVADSRRHLGTPKLPPIVVAHQGFKGSYLNSRVRDRTGIQVSGLDGLVVVTGHYHMPQNVAQVIYCGSPYQTSHAETGQEKGCLAWPRVAATRAQANATWVDWLPERRPYASVTAPRYWTVTWDGTGEPKLPAGHREGDIVRVVTTLTRDGLEGAPAKALKKAGLAGAAIVTASASSPQVSLRSVRPEDAVDEYLIAARKDGVDPTDLREFMQAEGAWPGV